ncbi:MAG TPA: protein kinase [Candidatus Acidoferrales bacterium]|nr:protein kinase [Candidatus Acidoferrales bacterium]
MGEAEQDMEIAHILSVQIAEFAALPINEQTAALQGLSAAVNSTSAIQSAQRNQQLIGLATGDGMSLAFFGSPEAPLRSAIGIAAAARETPGIRLRMGIHSGPVFRMRDMQGRESIAGGGMTTAQRVMECGDAGHILLSAAIAEVLAEHTRWKPLLSDLGSVELKAGSSVRLYNFCSGEAGNAEIPASVSTGRRSPSGVGEPTVGSPSGAPPAGMTAATVVAAAAPRGIPELQSGSALGEYEILGELGAGGIGKVYKARHTISQRMEALKVLQQDQLGTPEMAERFVREIRVLASLNHPHIAALHTAFRHEDRLVMVMEYVEGTALSSECAAARVSIAQAVEYVRQVLQALVYAHERGVIHRDIKPSNIIIVAGAAPSAKLLDFGLAVSGHDPSFTASGTILGSLYYMSPEQVRGARVDARSDLYSLGVTLYEMVSGRRPFEGASQYEIMDGHLRQPPQPVNELNPNVSIPLAGVILKAMAKAPSARFQTAAEFLRALDEAAGTGGGVAPGADAGAAAMPVPPAAAPAPGTGSSRSGDWVTPAMVQQIARVLAEYIGPIAHIIVERTAAHCRDVEELYAALALEIESPGDRARFLASRSKKKA